MNPFHMRQGLTGRAFVKPRGLLNRLYLWRRGWRPHTLGPLWQKPSPNLRLIEGGDMSPYFRAMRREIEKQNASWNFIRGALAARRHHY